MTMRNLVLLRRQGGVSVITAVFLLLLMAGLAAGMATLLAGAHINMAADIGGSRAYQAARAGAEWGIFQLDPNAAAAGLPGCPASPTVINAIPGHRVEVTCEAFPGAATWYQEGGKQIRIFRFVSTATTIGVRAPGIERQVVVTIEKCRDAAITAAPFDC